MPKRRVIQTGPNPNFLTGRDIRYIDDDGRRAAEPGRWRDAVADGMSRVARAFAGRPPGGDYYGLKAPPPLTREEMADLRAQQFSDGFRVTGSIVERDNPRIPDIRPNDVVEINRHAMFGDGSPREIDFRQVSLEDLGGSLQAIARTPGSSLADAISEAARTGRPVRVTTPQVIAAKSVLESKTPLSQQLGIGRFGVTIDGHVRASGRQ